MKPIPPSAITLLPISYLEEQLMAAFVRLVREKDLSSTEALWETWSEIIQEATDALDLQGLEFFHPRGDVQQQDVLRPCLEVSLYEESLQEILLEYLEGRFSEALLSLHRGARRVTVEVGPDSIELVSIEEVE